MNVSDMFVVCTISYVYTPEISQVLFTDILSNKPLILNESQLQVVNNSLISYTEERDCLPTNVCFLGRLVRDSEHIYAIDLHSMQIITLQCHNCYLERVEKGIALVDEITHIKIGFVDRDNEYMPSIQKVIHGAYTDKDCDFSRDGYDRITCIGNANLRNEILYYELDNSFYMNTPAEVTNQLFSSITGLTC